MNFQDLQNRISEYYATLDFPETKNSFENLKNKILYKWTNELKDLIINDEFTFDDFNEELNIISVDEIKSIYQIKVNRTSYPIEQKIKYIIKTNWIEGNIENKTIINEIKKINKGDKINVNLKFSGVNCYFEKLIQNDEKTTIFELIFVLKSFEIIHKIEYQKINLFQLKEKISDYCNQFNLPKNESEDTEFKKVFDHNWKKEIHFLLFEDILTFQKKEFGIHFIETELKNSLSSKILVFFNFNHHPQIEKLNDGDKVNIRCKIIKIESTRINGYQGMAQPQFNIVFEINSFEIVEKFDEEFEIKKLEEKILKKEETENESKDNRINETISTNNIINQTGKLKSFKDLLNILLEIDDLKYKSRQRKSDLNSFQNKVFNEKKLEEYNTKKKEIENYIGLEFNTICEVSEIREHIIDFKLYHRNKIFFLGDKMYNKNLKNITFFLKNNSSVEISFKIKEIKDVLNSFNIELTSIKKNNKVKLFGKFIKLEYFWLGIYVSLILFTLILFSDIHFYGVIPFLFKLTLWVFFCYLINKLLVKKIYKN